MPDNSVQGVNRADFSDPSRVQTQNTKAESLARLSENAGMMRSSSKDKSAASQEAKPQAIVNNLSDVRLKFQVDPETQHVTVLVVDKASKKIIRTIPAEDIQKMNKGDLFELST
jgi:uncharacterized FlaG/YvyC family protein